MGAHWLLFKTLFGQHICYIAGTYQSETGHIYVGILCYVSHGWSDIDCFLSGKQGTMLTAV